MKNVVNALTVRGVAIVAAAFEEWTQIHAVGIRVGRAIVSSSDAFIDVDTRALILARETRVRPPVIAEAFLYRYAVLGIAWHAIATIGTDGIDASGCEFRTDVLFSSSVQAFVDIYENESKQL